MSLFNKIKTVKDLRSKAKTMQSALEQEKIEINHKGVKIVMDGNQKILDLSISADLLNKENKLKLEDAVKEAIEESIKKVQKVMAVKMREMGGLENFGL